MGTQLLKDFLGRSYIDVVGLADTDPDSPGMRLARDHGIFTCQYADVLAAKGANLDLIIDVSGDPSVKRALKEAFVAQGNKRTVIVHDLVARLVMSLAEDSPTLIDTVHPDDQGVG